MSEMLSISEAVAMLGEYRIYHSDQMLRRWLRQGKIQGEPPISRKKGWRIPVEEVWHLIQAPALEGTSYEYGIDEQTMIKRLIEENQELKDRISKLQSENQKLLEKLELDVSVPF